MQTSSGQTAATLRAAFYGTLALTLAFKFWLAGTLPMTGDEAYFIYWGVYPELGFYDHPPMVGWFLALLLQMSRAEWVLRLPVIVLPALMAFAMLRYLRPVEEGKAYLAALAFLLLPVNVWNVLITTDTPLVLFSFLSALCFAAALRRQSQLYFAVSGAMLGLAFLSKYFAVLLGFVYLAYVVLQPAGRRDLRGLATLVVCVLPFALFNAWWNYEHCWANLQFNVYNRHDDAGWSLRTPALYLLSVLYMLSPVALYQFWRGRAALSPKTTDARARFFMLAWIAPLAVFALLSAVKQIGLHWLLSFVPFFFIAAALVLSAAQLKRSIVYLCAFSLVHVAAIAACYLLPMETWKISRLYDGIVFHVKTAELLQQLEPYAGKYEFSADGFSPAVTASYASGRYFFVFGTASSHGRHDDILTDFRRLAGKNILVLRKNPPNPADYAPYFAKVELREFELYGARFHLVLGEGFDYPAYRDQVLRPLRDRYYRIPSYLPSGHCYFCERYFPDEPCPTR
ncbi:MAG: glycosyltransferase family 39 protein [Proteobacteria bacterium]|nr:glycosyltransferase family 39 protein [Pseudomonadota bacterium]